MFDSRPYQDTDNYVKVSFIPGCIVAKYLYAILVWWQRKPIMKLH